MYRITAADMQARLLRMVGGQAEPEMVSDLRMAIRSALRMVSAENTWPYYCDYLHLLTNEEYITGTITYTASTRTVTLAGGTWPSWIDLGSLIIDTFHARVDTVIDSTTLTVTSADAPVSDYTGSYTVYQYRFRLPTDYNIYKVGKIFVNQLRWLEFVPPDLFESETRRRYIPSTGGSGWISDDHCIKHCCRWNWNSVRQ